MTLLAPFEVRVDLFPSPWRRTVLRNDHKISSYEGFQFLCCWDHTPFCQWTLEQKLWHRNQFEDWEAVQCIYSVDRPLHSLWRAESSRHSKWCLSYFVEIVYSGTNTSVKIEALGHVRTTKDSCVCACYAKKSSFSDRPHCWIKKRHHWPIWVEINDVESSLRTLP